MYLSNIRISNFRTYGPEFEINLPSGPGLTILTGMNGLGKTAFFEALEWALTGQVQRLGEKVKPTVISRHGSPSNSHEVCLSWGEQSIKRGALTGTSLSDVVSLLKDDAWTTPISDPVPYLRLTHFLPQSSGIRFLQQTKDQWGMLKGPAGIDRLEGYRLLLDDRKARNAFSAKSAKISGDRTIAQQKLTLWNELLQQRSNLQHLADLTMPVASEDIAPRINDIAHQLSQPHENDLKNSDLGAAIDSLKMLRRLADDWVRSINEAESKIPAATDALARATQGRSEQEELTEKFSQQSHAHAVTCTYLANETETLRLAKIKSQETKDRLDTLEAASRLMLRIIEADQLKQSKLKDLNATESNIERLANQRKALDLERERVLLQVTARRKIAESASDASAQEQSIAQRMKLYALALGRQERAAQQVNLKPQLKATKEAAEAIIATEEPKLAGNKLRLENLQTKLRAAQRVGDEVAKAVAIIAGNLNEEDLVCPVCSHDHEPGHLAKAAALAVSKTGIESGSILKELEATQGEIKRLESLVDAQKAIQSETTSKIAAIEWEQQAAAAEFAAFEAEAISLNIEAVHLGDSFSKQLADCSKRKGALMASLSSLESAETLDNKLEKAQLQLKEADEEISTLRTGRSEIKLDVERAEAVLGEASAVEIHKNDIPALFVSRTKAVADLASLEVPHRESLTAVSKTQETVKEWRKQVESLENQKRVYERALIDARQKIEAANDHWKASGLAGEPSEAGLIQKQQEILDQRARATVVVQQIDSIGEAADIWSKKGLLLKADHAIQKFLSEEGIESSVQCTEFLALHLRKAEADEQRITEVSDRAAAIATDLTSMSKGFSERAFTPLSKKITEFNKLISPFQYTYNIRARITETSAKTSSSIGVPSLIRDEVLDCDIATWLSEGQTAALGLSVLFGASTVYRWSKWRALLLDDPLHNTDLIHAAAFADIIRGLIKDEGYQILLSTHSMEEADYLQRKCRSAGLPVRRVSLLSLGPEGVRYRNDFQEDS